MIKNIIKSIIKKTGFEVSKIDNQINTESYDLFTLLGFDVPYENYSFLYRGRVYINNLKKQGGVFTFQDQNLFIIINNLKFHVTSFEELFIFNEVFVEGVYNYITLKDFTFIDIGMNVGVTSIYFSNLANCKKVFSYEPMEKTREYAIKNMSLNNCANKISFYDFGLGYPERDLTIEYSEEYKGSVGINGVASYISVEEKFETILKIKDADIYISKNIEEAQGKIIMKIDCEGAEYEIIKRIAETGLLEKITFIMIEWHLNGPNDLISFLKEQSFEILSFNEKSKTIGMLYAFSR
jgi:FkbM family methyltransferase